MFFMNTETGFTSLLQVLWIHNFCVKSIDYETKSNKVSVSAKVLKEEMLYWKQTRDNGGLILSLTQTED